MEDHLAGDATDHTCTCDHSPSAVKQHDLPSWRLDINHFRLPQSSFESHGSSTIRRMLRRTPSACEGVRPGLGGCGRT
ncbi:hypothetical protein Hanom_Chr11g00992541 [Helianthus anomalus]